MLVFSGDWHGNFEKVIKKIKRLDLRDCIIIQVGDFGVGFTTLIKESKTLNYFNITLKTRNIMLYVIRGNHDNPIYFNGGININKSNITLLPDYSVLNIDGLNILCVGGAISVDRKPNPEVFNEYGKPHKGRKENVNYWIDEKFVLKPELLKDLNNIDVVVTHSCPHFCKPIFKDNIEKWVKYDNELTEDCDKERNDHSKLYNILKENSNPISHWFHGHFHFSNTEYFNDTKFVLLNINEFYELRT